MKKNVIFNNIKPKDQSVFWNNLEIAQKKFNNFFHLEKNYKINVFNSFREYCLALNEKRPKWGVSKQKDGNIFLFNPSKWEISVTGHCPEDLVSSLVHEMFHVYCFRKNINLPNWLEEGIATYLGQNSKFCDQTDLDFLRLKKQFHLIPDLPNLSSNFSEHQNHPWSYLSACKFIKYIVNKKGKNFLKKISIIDQKDNNQLFINDINLMWTNFKEDLNG